MVDTLILLVTTCFLTYIYLFQFTSNIMPTSNYKILHENTKGKKVLNNYGQERVSSKPGQLITVSTVGCQEHHRYTFLKCIINKTAKRKLFKKKKKSNIMLRYVKYNFLE